MSLSCICLIVSFKDVILCVILPPSLSSLHLLFSVLRIEPGASCMLGKHLSIELHPSPRLTLEKQLSRDIPSTLLRSPRGSRQWLLVCSQKCTASSEKESSCSWAWAPHALPSPRLLNHASFFCLQRFMDSAHFHKHSTSWCIQLRRRTCSILWFHLVCFFKVNPQCNICRDFFPFRG